MYPPKKQERNSHELLSLKINDMKYKENSNYLFFDAQI